MWFRTLYCSTMTKSRLVITLPSQHQIIHNFPTHAHTPTTPFLSFFPSRVPLYSSLPSRDYLPQTSRLKLHSYSAPGMPAAMQQSKWSVILHHSLPWEHGNAEERRGGEKKGDGEGKRETWIWNLWDWRERGGMSGGIKQRREAGSQQFFPTWATGDPQRRKQQRKRRRKKKRIRSSKMDSRM